ncbi:uncharacterized protein [Desmodus rotundus]|uniref:uncharacterized protein isoform X2 n=1 Tax=Desmodus rotundus TaxID=9430 RepID=UPI002380F972|nr:uncharacterized protein LOC128779380 isoform X3 [Desmodus rotundus]
MNGGRRQLLQLAQLRGLCPLPACERRWGSSTQDNQCEHRTGEKKKTAKSLLPAPVTSALVRPGKKEDALIDGEGGPPISERNYSDDSEGRSYGQLVDWQLHHENVPAPASCLVQSFLAKHQITQRPGRRRKAVTLEVWGQRSQPLCVCSVPRVMPRWVAVVFEMNK